MSFHQKVFHSVYVLSFTTGFIPKLILTIFIAQKVLPDTHPTLHEHLIRFDRKTLSVEYMSVDSTGYHYAAGGGDVNGDGFDDFLLGSDREMHLHFGSHTESFQDSDLRGRWRFWFDDFQSVSKRNIDIVGDINGDGFDDILLGEPYHDLRRLSTGRVSLFLGSPTVPSLIPDFIWRGTHDQDGYGHTAKGAGDLNGDGLSDILITTESPQQAEIIYGSSNSTFDSLKQLPMQGWGNLAPDCRITFAPGGDINGDGYDDILAFVGCSNAHLLLWSGSASGLSPSPKIISLSNYQFADAEVHLLGENDFNGDGWDDVLLSNQSLSSVLLFLGEEDGLNKNPISITKPTESTHIDIAVLEDINGDGLSDFVLLNKQVEDEIGKTPIMTFYLGQKESPHLVLSDPTTKEKQPLLRGTLISSARNIVSIGDVNADGLSDFAIGSNIPLMDQKQSTNTDKTETFPIVDIFRGKATVPIIHVIQPKSGLQFDPFSKMHISAVTTDPAGHIFQVKFHLLDQLRWNSPLNKPSDFASGDPIIHHFSRRAPRAQTMMLEVVGVSSNGETVRSKQVPVIINDSSPDALRIHRELPEHRSYLPESKIDVKLIIEYPKGRRRAGALVVEETLPKEVTWQIREISHKGIIDPATGNIKFGPIYDNGLRDDLILTYSLATRPHLSPIPNKIQWKTPVRAGYGVRAAHVVVTGDNTLYHRARFHPAELISARWDTGYKGTVDSRIDLDELAYYANAWQTGSRWHFINAYPRHIPIDYATRAAWIWKRGEHYKWNFERDQAPFWWEPRLINQSIQPRMIGRENQDVHSTLVQSTVLRNVSLITDGNDPSKGTRIVRVSGIPKEGASAVEEHLPKGWIASNISHQGFYDQDAGVIRWGPFFNENPKSIRYEIQGPIDQPFEPNGVISVSGLSQEISTANASPQIQIHQTTGKNIQITFDGILQYSEQPTGPFKSVLNAKSPYIVPNERRSGYYFAK